MIGFNIVAILIGATFSLIANDGVWFGLGFCAVWAGGIASDFLPKSKPKQMDIR